MKVFRILIPLGAVALCACSTVLASSASSQLEAQCAERGMQFVETDRELNEGLVISSASVSGICVGPEDPRFVPPADADGAADPAV